MDKQEGNDKKVEKMKKPSVVIRVSPDFKKKLKLKAIEEDKSLTQLTEELAKDKRRKFKDETFFRF